jgi:phosphatidylglycerol:prolipoprotein diacylglycerol transferase
MYPKLLEYQNVTIYTYAFCVVLGTFLAVIYTRMRAKKELTITLPNTFFYTVFALGFIGGKLFLFLEKPQFYLQNPKQFLAALSGGFVFYGSFICIILYIIWYLKKHKIPVLPVLDILAITTTIVHAIGRLGCFFAGCCYGKPTDSIFGVKFPTNNFTAVHPTQLYEVSSILLIMMALFFLTKRKQFNGQIFLSYVMLYAIARCILELFRGDTRGYFVTEILSHSQGIALLLMGIASYTYIKLINNNNTLKQKL